MSLYLQKLLPYKIVSLLCLVLADILLFGAFCWLFADERFGLAYYDWLKFIDMGCIPLLVLAVFVGLVLLTPFMLKGEPRGKKALHIIFDIIQIIMLVILFFNLISFYENVEHILLLVSIGAFLTAQVVLMLGYVLVDKYMMLVDDDKGSILGVPQCVQAYDKNKKLTTYLSTKEIDENIVIKNNYTIISVIVCFVGYVALGIVGTFVCVKLGVLVGANIAWYVGGLCLLVVLVGLVVLLAKLRCCSIKYARDNRWVELLLIIVNLLLIVGIIVFVCLPKIFAINSIILFLSLCYALCMEYVLVAEYARQKYMSLYIKSKK